MTRKEVLKEWLSQTDQTNFKEGHYFVIEEAMKEYTRLKCQELLLLVAEKAEENFTYSFGYSFEDKDSILNVVDLEKFCS